MIPRKTARELRRDLEAALASRRMHSEDCPHWDYDENNCVTCDVWDAKVRSLRERLDAQRAREHA